MIFLGILIFVLVIHSNSYSNNNNSLINIHYWLLPLEALLLLLLHWAIVQPVQTT